MRMRNIIVIAFAAMGLALAGCGAKGPDAELKAAQDAVAAAKAGQVDAANADLKGAEEAIAKAEKEIAEQSKGMIKDFTVAKDLLGKAKALGEKALAEQQAKGGKAEAPKAKS